MSVKELRITLFLRELNENRDLCELSVFSTSQAAVDVPVLISPSAHN